MNMLAATGPWVVGRGIYRFDPDFCEELAKTEMTKIPYQQLMNMPEWCTYIPYVHDRLPENIKGQFEEYDGFFAYLEEDDRYHVPELRISNVKISQDESGRDKIVLEPIFIELISEDLDVCTHRIDFNALENEEIGENKSNNYKQLLQDQILYCLQLLLCICAENIEKTPVNLPAQKTNRQHLKDSQDSNEYMDSCRKWEVGTRIGAAIRSWKSEKKSGTHDAYHGGQRHQKPRPHLRRAHWHTYLTGPRSEEQKRVLRWISPLEINVVIEDEMPTVLHSVKK